MQISLGMKLDNLPTHLWVFCFYYLGTVLFSFLWPWKTVVPDSSSLSSTHLLKKGLEKKASSYVNISSWFYIFFLPKQAWWINKVNGRWNLQPWESSTHCRERWMDGDDVMTSALKWKVGTAGCSSTEKRGKKKTPKLQPVNFIMLKERDA